MNELVVKLEDSGLRQCQTRLTSPRLGPLDRKCHMLWQLSPRLGTSRMLSTDLGPIPASIGPAPPKFRQCWPRLDQFWRRQPFFPQTRLDLAPKPARFRPTFGPISSNISRRRPRLGRIRPMFTPDFGHVFPGLVRFWATPPAFLRVRPNLAWIGPILAYRTHCLPTSAISGPTSIKPARLRPTLARRRPKSARSRPNLGDLDRVLPPTGRLSGAKVASDRSPSIAPQCKSGKAPMRPPDWASETGGLTEPKRNRRGGLQI